MQPIIQNSASFSLPSFSNFLKDEATQMETKMKSFDEHSTHADIDQFLQSNAALDTLTHAVQNLNEPKLENDVEKLRQTATANILKFYYPKEGRFARMKNDAFKAKQLEGELTNKFFMESRVDFSNPSAVPEALSRLETTEDMKKIRALQKSLPQELDRFIKTTHSPSKNRAIFDGLLSQFENSTHLDLDGEQTLAMITALRDFAPFAAMNAMGMAHHPKAMEEEELGKERKQKLIESLRRFENTKHEFRNHETEKQIHELLGAFQEQLKQ